MWNGSHLLTAWFLVYWTCKVSIFGYGYTKLMVTVHSKSLVFQSFILIMDIPTYRLNRPRGQCSENNLKCITRCKGKDGIIITIFFQVYMCWELNHLFIIRHPHKDFKWTKLCKGLIYTCLLALSGFLGKTKIKADTKLIVVLCCQIFDRKSVAPSSGNLGWRPAPR